MSPSTLPRLVAGAGLAVYAAAFVALAVFVDPWVAAGIGAIGAANTVL